MMKLSVVFTALAVILTTPGVLAAPGPSLRTVETFSGAKTGNYIVKLKPGVSRKQWIKKLKLSSATVDWDIINGFSGLSSTIFQTSIIADQLV